MYIAIAICISIIRYTVTVYFIRIRSNDRRVVEFISRVYYPLKKRTPKDSRKFTMFDSYMKLLNKKKKKKNVR